MPMVGGMDQRAIWFLRSVATTCICRSRAACTASTIARFAAGADDDEDVTAATVAAHLTAEDLLEAVVITDRGQDRAVAGQRHDRIGRALPPEAANQLGGEMLRLGGTPAISGDQNRATGVKWPG